MYILKVFVFFFDDIYDDVQLKLLVDEIDGGVVIVLLVCVLCVGILFFLVLVFVLSVSDDYELGDYVGI